MLAYSEGPIVPRPSAGPRHSPRLPHRQPETCAGKQLNRLTLRGVLVSPGPRIPRSYAVVLKFAHAMRFRTLFRTWRFSDVVYAIASRRVVLSFARVCALHGVSPRDRWLCVLPGWQTNVNVNFLLREWCEIPEKRPRSSHEGSREALQYQYPDTYVAA